MSDQKIKIRKKLKGVVISDKNDKTVTVLVTRFIKHRLYGKYFRVGKKYRAHDEKNEFKKGDTVIIEEHRPLSKNKHFKVLQKA